MAALVSSPSVGSLLAVTWGGVALMVLGGETPPWR